MAAHQDKELKNAIHHGLRVGAQAFLHASGLCGLELRRNNPVIRGSFPLHGASIPRSTAAGSGPCASMRVSVQRANRMHATVICSRKGKRAFLWRSISPRKLVWIRIILWRVEKWVAWAWPSTRSKTWKCLFADISLERVSASMTINSTGAILLALYLRWRKSRVQTPPFVRYRPE